MYKSITKLGIFSLALKILIEGEALFGDNSALSEFNQPTKLDNELPVNREVRARLGI